jgi:hypothetical protein
MSLLYTMTNAKRTFELLYEYINMILTLRLFVGKPNNTGNGYKEKNI